VATDIKAIRVALAGTVQAALPELNCYPRLVGLVDPPAFIVVGPEVTYDITFGGGDQIDGLVCRLLAPAGDDQDGDDLLDQYLSSTGARSVKRAIEGTPGVAQTLGGLISDLHVASAGNYDTYPYGENQYPGAELVVQIIGLPG